MAYWCDDQALNLEQQQLDAEQQRARERMVEGHETLVERLRGQYRMGEGNPPEFGVRQFPTTPICVEAADEIERLREALKPFAQPDLLKEFGGNVQGDNSPVYGREKAVLYLGDFRRAAKALEKTNEQ